jgi:2-iminobutanoate/2-iminopropanoate deaminase
MREVIPAPVPGLDLHREYGHHQSPAIRAGGMVFCSGMVAIDPQSGERQHGTVTSEARRIFDNLKLLLESTGSSLDRLVQVHAMIYDRIEYDVLNRLYRQYVPNAPPARTVMSVQIEAGFKVMLDVIAAAETRQPAAMIYPRQVVEPGGWRRPGLPANEGVPSATRKIARKSASLYVEDLSSFRIMPRRSGKAPVPSSGSWRQSCVHDTPGRWRRSGARIDRSTARPCERAKTSISPAEVGHKASYGPNLAGRGQPDNDGGNKA